MIKTKDFTLASKNLGVGHMPSCPTNLPPMVAPSTFFTAGLCSSNTCICISVPKHRGE